VHEIAVTGAPAILVPWSGAAGDHQTANARWLGEREAAVVLTEDRIGDLAPTIDRLRADAPGREAMGERARAMGDVHRSGALADLVEAVALA
jgi:UDP-N-acetylglucosamine--N-acetylmuramyl-(pentapeptide) pyrophosphoryl-undecaprenol N-acetylglucosamine transferase